MWELPIRRYEPADHQSAAVKPILHNKPRGVPRVNDRRVLDGIFGVPRSGAPWRDLPDAFGPWLRCVEPSDYLGADRAAVALAGSARKIKILFKSGRPRSCSFRDRFLAWRHSVRLLLPSVTTALLSAGACAERPTLTSVSETDALVI
jgi:transposase